MSPLAPGAEDWARFFEELRQHVGTGTPPSLNQVTDAGATPFQILVSTILSLRTRDEVTLKTSRQLFERASTPQAVAALSEDEVAQLIYPTAFYQTKARQLKAIAQELFDKPVPGTRDELMKLPGVGPKTANLVLNLAFGVPAICVDTHVHRISNRLGWVETKSANDTEAALDRILPREHWIEINPLFVKWGQTICLPRGPRCPQCYLNETCPKIGVARKRLTP